MESKNTQSNFGLTGRIERKTHSIDSLKSQYDEWDNMSKSEKLDSSRQIEPDETDTVYNVTTTNLHEYFVNNLDPNQNSVEDNVNISFIGLGTDSATGTTVGDDDLNNRVYEEQVTDVTDNGAEILSSTFVDSTEANGFNIDEVGLYSGDPANLSNSEVFLLNHATFAAVTKDNTKTVTFDVTLSFSDA